MASRADRRPHQPSKTGRSRKSEHHGATDLESHPEKPHPASRKGNAFVKRAFDIAISLIGLVVFGPLMLLIALLILVTDGRPVLFAHQRIGREGRPFDCLKFRTMARDPKRILELHLEKDPVARREWATLRKLQADPRITSIGAFLRKTSLDELPQLINVLRGDMSMVGPRPVVLAETARYGRYISYYCNTRPGLTGLWQVSGRNLTTYRRRVALDIYYCRNQNIYFDLLIVVRTVPVILSGHGAY